MLSAIGIVLENSTEVRRVNTYEQVESGRGYGKSGNGWMSPYITPPSKCGITMHKYCQEVARSALVKGIESKIAMLIQRAVPGYLWWNSTIFGFAWTCV
jgi:hypothetical protein